LRPRGGLWPALCGGLLLLCLCLPATAQHFAEVGASAGVASPEGSISMAWGDCDNDGDLDLYLTTRRENRLYRNNGNGRFTEVAASAGVDYSGGSQALWADYDNDGDLDLLILDEGLNLLYRNQGDGTFVDVAESAQIQFGPDRTLSGAWADYDRDGDLDFNTTSPLRLYRNNGQGAFAEVGQQAGLDRSGGTGTAWADYDGDGDPDLYVADYTSANGLYRNQGNGTFAKAGLNPAESAIAASWGDFDNDGDFDLHLVNHLGVFANRLYRNDGADFAEVGDASGVADIGIGASAAWGDADSDGDLDLYLVRELSPNLYYQNNGNGAFTETGVAQGVDDSGQGEGAAWGDYDNDGDLDLYLVNRRSANRLYRNSGNANHWLSLHLSGRASNHSAIGAKVVALTGALRQTRQVEGAGLRAQGSLPVELGFGGAARIDTLAIHWPSGAQQVLAGVAPDQTLALSEPVPVAVSPRSLSFGTADLGQTARAALWVKNLGRHPLAVAGLRSSDPQFSAAPSRFTLAPGDSQQVALAFAPLRSGAQEAVLTLSQETPGSDLNVELRGVGRRAPPAGDLTLSRIAFTSARDGHPALYTTGISGSGQARLLAGSAGEEHPSWAPDGTQLAFSGAEGDLYTIGLDGQDLVPLIQHPAADSQPVWSPDGARLAFVSTRSGNPDLYTCNPDGSDLRQITTHPASDSEPAWSPDGARLAFVSARSGNPDLYTCNPDGSGLRQLTTHPASDSEPAWSPDGARLAFVSARSGNPDLYTCDPHGENLLPLVTHPAEDTQPSWSPDGARLAFVSTRSGNPDLYTCDPRGENLLQLTAHPADDSQPAWGPLLTAPLLSLSTRSLAFAEVDRGEAATAFFSVSNAGGGVLAVAQIDLGPHFRAEPSRFSVGPGANQVIALSFAPAGAGPQADTLRLVSNALRGFSRVALSGTGLDTPPAPPPGLSALPGRGRVLLSWPASPAADLAYYALHRGRTADFALQPAEPLALVRPPALTWADSGLGAGTYYYRAVAVDSAGNRSLPSPLAGASLAPLLRAGDPAPSSLTFRGAGTQTLSLADSGNAALSLTPTLAGPDAGLFSVSPATAVQVAPGSAQTLSLSFDPGAATGAHRSATLYLAHDAANRPTPLSVALVGDLPPQPPVELRALTGPHQVSLSWSANPEPDLSHYVVYHSLAPTAQGDSVGRVEAPGLSFVHTGLGPGRHYYRVRAVDAGGSPSAPSAPSRVLIAPILALSLASEPPALPFGSVRTDTSRTLSFSIANEGSAPLTISAVFLSGPQAAVFSAAPASLTIAPGEAPRTLRVSFAPTAAGEQRATLTLLHNAAPAATVTAVDLSGSGALSTPLEIAPDPLDFGRVRVGQRRTLALTLRNRGGTPLSVTRLGVGDPAFALSRSGLLLPPGGSDTLSATFAPADGSLRNGVLSASYYTALSGASTLTALLSGQGQWSRLELLPADSLRFGDLPPGQRRTLSLIALNQGNDTLLATALSTQPAFAISPSSFALPGGAHRELSVTYTPAAARPDTGSVLLSANAGLRSVGLSGRGAAARLALRPGALDFGRVWVGGSGRLFVRAANQGNLPLALGAVLGDNPQFAAQRRAFDLEPGDSLEVAVRFSPSQAGPATGTLDLGPYGALPLRGEGVRLGLPDSLLFDQVLAGESGELNLVVFNPADDTLQLHGALVDRLQIFQVAETPSATAPLRVPPNDSRGLRVRFTPAGTGTQRALLTLSTNAGVYTLPLVGAVSEVALRLSPAEFGQVRLGRRQSLRVIALNRTAAPLRLDSLLVLPANAPVQVLSPPLPLLVPGRDSAEVARLEFAPLDPGPLDGVSLRVVGAGLERSAQLRGAGIGPRLVLGADTLFLGPAGVGETALDSLLLHNSGNDTLRLSGIGALPSAFAAAPTALVLPPGASRHLTLQFRPTAATPVEGRLELTSNDPLNLRPGLVLRGLPATRAPVLQWVGPADTLRFGAVPLGQSQEQALRVRNRGQGLLKVWLRAAGPEFLPAAADTLILGSGQEAELYARFAPAAPGPRQGRLTLLANDPQVSTLSIPAIGLGAGLFFSPPGLDLGRVAVGSAADTALSLVNQTAAPVMVELSLTRGAFALGLERLRLDPGATARLPLRFAPDQDGEFVARLRVVGQNLEAGLAGIGAPPPQVQAPAVLDLGQVDLGQVGRRPLVVRNQGRGPLRLEALHSNRLEFGVADSLPLLVPPGGERLVQVWFAPRAPGLLRANLRLYSDDPGQPEWTVALSGQGRAGTWQPPRLEAHLEGGAEVFDFGSLAAGASAERGLTLINEGAGVLRVRHIGGGDLQVRAEPESLVVGPGERRQVRVRLLAAPGAPTAGIVELASDDPGQPLRRWAWSYRQAAARSQVLGGGLVFGPEEEGGRRAALAVANQGEGQLVVDLADEQGQLRFDADRLLVAPGQVGRALVEYRGLAGSGLLELPSNDPARPRLAIPWEAADLLDLVRALPAGGTAGVARRTTLSLLFDQPLRLEGLEAFLVPAPLSPWRAQVQGGELRLPLELAAGQAYKLVLLSLHSATGNPLAAPLELGFTTAAQASPLGRIEGRALRPDGRGLAGLALLAGAGQELAGTARLDGDGRFALTLLPAGVYHLFVREEGSGQSHEYPQPLTLAAGQTLGGLELRVPSEAPQRGAFPLAAALEVELAPLLGADSTFALPVRTGPVPGLTGFSFHLSFDPEALRLVEALPAPPDAHNLLYAGGGFPLFHTRHPAPGQVEFGGQLLAPRAETAPDSGGALAYLVFRALGPGAAVRLDSLVRHTLEGTEVLTGPLVRPAHGADFDGSGLVGLDDLFLMADFFGQPASGAARRYDLDGDGVVDLGDFFRYADAFGPTPEARARLRAKVRGAGSR